MIETLIKEERELLGFDEHDGFHPYGKVFVPLTTVSVILPVTSNAWQDLDLSAYLPAEANGVVALFWHSDASATGFGFRMKGSTDDRRGRASGSIMAGVLVGCDAYKVIQWNSGGTSFPQYLRIVGYTRGPNIIFKTNGIDISPTAGSWQTVDLSSSCPGALAVLLEVYSTDAGQLGFGARKNGGSDERLTNTYGHNTHDIIIGCDSSQLVNLYREGTNLKFYLRGYITKDVTLLTNASDITPFLTGSWEERVVPTGRVDAYKSDATHKLWLLGYQDNDLAFFEAGNETDSGNLGVRKHGETGNLYGYPIRHPWFFSKIGSRSGVSEQTIFHCSAVNLTNGAAFNWGDIDVSAYVPSNATGVLLYLLNGFGSSRNWGVRCKGCSDTRGGSCNSGNWHSWAFIGLDSNRTFQFYNISSTPRINAYLMGYTISGINFSPSAVSAPDISPTAGSWQVVDLSAYVPAGASGVIVEVYRSGGTGVFGYRKNGSTDTQTGSQSTNHTTFGFWIGCDTDRKIELYRSSTSLKFYLIGYVTSGVTFFTNRVDAVPGGWGSGWSSFPSPGGSIAPLLDLLPGGYAEASGSFGPAQTTKVFGDRTMAIPGECPSLYTLYDSVGGGSAYLVGYAKE